MRFRDYGNVAEVDEQFVLPRFEEIPEEDLLANILDVNLVFNKAAHESNFSKRTESESLD